MRRGSGMLMARFCRMVAVMMSLVAATCLFSACSDDEEGTLPNPNYASSRTVIMYMVAENSLNSAARLDVGEALQGMGSDSLQQGDRLVVYLDDVSLPRIYVITKGERATSLSELEPVMTYEEDVNSASAEQLRRVIRYVKANYPADSYGLVMWSHASGWLPSTYDGDSRARRRSFGLDNGANSSSRTMNGNQMEIEDMAQVIEEEGGADFVFFDACFMQNVEVAYALRNATKWVVASPAEIPAPGADYRTMVPAMFRKDDYAERMLDVYYTTYMSRADYGIIISAVKTAEMTNFAAQMKTLVANHREAILAVDGEDLLNYHVYGRWTTAYSDFYDMRSLMQHVLSADECAVWERELAKVVSLRCTGFWYTALSSSSGMRVAVDEDACGGISMFVPRSVYDYSVYRYNDAFLGTEWAEEVWNGNTGLE